jgi:hypothetical protein
MGKVGSPKRGQGRYKTQASALRLASGDRRGSPISIVASRGHPSGSSRNLLRTGAINHYQPGVVGVERIRHVDHYLLRCRVAELADDVGDNLVWDGEDDDFGIAGSLGRAPCSCTVNLACESPRMLRTGGDDSDSVTGPRGARATAPPTLPAPIFAILAVPPSREDAGVCQHRERDRLIPGAWPLGIWATDGGRHQQQAEKVHQEVLRFETEDIVGRLVMESSLDQLTTFETGKPESSLDA